MKSKHLLLLPLLPFLALVQASPSTTETSITLNQCYEWAKIQSEELRILEHDIQQAQARGQAALGEAFPRVAWKLNQTWNDPSGVKELERQGFTGFAEKSQVESKFTVEQPLFSGLREFSAHAGFKKESLRNTLLLERATYNLYEQTAQAFYAVINQETHLKNTTITLELAEGRAKELRDFLKLGKARESEVFTAEAYGASLKANRDQIIGALHSAQQELSFLTGRPLVDVPLKDDLADALALPALTDALALLKNRTDLRAQQEEVDAMKLRIRYEKGSFWPSADVTGNYYTERATFLDKIDWDVVLSVDFPLFQGGTVSASVKEARAAYRQAVLRLQKMERHLDFSVRKIYGDLSSSLQETASLEEATSAAQKSYTSLRKEYRLGLVTNLDVLQSLDFLQSQKSALDTARLKTKLLFIELNVAIEKPL